jgi:hypothetical protein
MDIVYVVTDGSYSDYSIRGVFSTEQKAQKFIDHLGNNLDSPTIEEWNLDDFDSDDERLPIKVTMDKYGNEAECEHYVSVFTTFNVVDTNRFNNKLCVNVRAKDDKHAIKIANEIRIGWLLEQDLKMAEEIKQKSWEGKL